MASFSRSALTRLFVLAGIWGCSFLFIKVALEGLAPAQVVLGRMLGGSAVLFATVAVRRERLSTLRPVWRHVVFVSLVANLLPFTLLTWGEQRIASGQAGVLNATTPLCTVLLALAALPDERLSRSRLLGLLVGFSGVVFVVAPWDSGGGRVSISGQLACLGAAASYAVAITWTKRYLSPSGLPPVVLAAGQIGCGAVLLLLVSPLVAADPVDLPWRVLACVALLGVFGTGIAYILFYGLIAEVGATSASLVTYLAPVVAVAMGVVVLGEHLGWNLFVGAAIVILGVAVTDGRIRLPGARRRGVTVTEPSSLGDERREPRRAAGCEVLDEARVALGEADVVEPLEEPPLREVV